jgi:hypothetical protein
MTEKKLVLDYSKWRCGDDDEYVMLGKGKTKLLNDRGFMCCLGQWALQEGATEEMIKDKDEPLDIKIGAKQVPFFRTDRPDSPLADQGFCSDAISINDDDTTSPAQKIERLKSLCSKHSITLEIINKS